ncbi:DUF317 domain-containing protein [Streptomyces sp. NPDC052101]|uniref:DUF317 domain-containing protein n=1 Tax=Streptomyces sp. NPDC052101 TaxID=3155763 RepID=UPI00343C9CB5
MSHERFYSRVNGPAVHGVTAVRRLDEVTPRYLAGGGDPRHVTEHLLAAGWTNHSVPGYPHVLLESPGQHLHLTLEPTAPEERDTWWRIHPANHQGWSAQFGGHTPVEIIAGFTDALHSAAPAPRSDPLHLAASRGWTRTTAGVEQAALSPDETAVLARINVPVVSDTPVRRWKAEVCIPRSDGRLSWIWGASIDERAPAAALVGFVSALTDPMPLLRDEDQTPARAFGYLDAIPSSISPEQHRRWHEQRLEQARRTLAATPPSPAGPARPQGGPAHRRGRR